MNDRDRELVETIRAAKDAQRARLDALIDARNALIEIERMYANTGAASSNKIANRARKASLLVQEILDLTMEG